jgi:hypothetical protein
MIQEDSQEQLRFFQDTMPTATPKKEKCAAIRDYSIFTGFWYGSCGAFVI